MHVHICACATGSVARRMPVHVHVARRMPAGARVHVQLVHANSHVHIYADSIGRTCMHAHAHVNAL